MESARTSRDKESTKQRLLEAVGKVLVKQGYKGIGVNAIAKEAGSTRC